MRHIGFLVGLVALCIGASLVIDLAFDVHVPILRALLAVILIAYGARLLVRGWARDRADTEEVWLDDQLFAPEGAPARDERYDVAFGRSVIDLTHLAEPDHDVTVSVHALFGAAVVKIDPTIPYDVVGHAALGEVQVPERRCFDHAPLLHLRVHATFAQCQVVEATT